MILFGKGAWPISASTYAHIIDELMTLHNHLNVGHIILLLLEILHTGIDNSTRSKNMIW